MRALSKLDETQRFLLTLVVIFLVFFGLNSLIPIVIQESEDHMVMHYKMSFSFVIGMAVGAVFFFSTIPQTAGDLGEEDVKSKNIAILRSALSDDERALVDIIKEHEGITQDSLRFRTGFSKSKVSALLVELENKSIISRERTGKTYKVSIGDWLASKNDEK